MYLIEISQTKCKELILLSMKCDDFKTPDITLRCQRQHWQSSVSSEWKDGQEAKR